MTTLVAALFGDSKTVTSSGKIISKHIPTKIMISSRIPSSELSPLYLSTPNINYLKLRTINSMKIPI